MKKYDSLFYSRQMNGSVRSASKIIPYILEMLAPIKIESVIDFGCGVGGWLAEFEKVSPGIKVTGLDFGNAKESQLLIQDNFFKKQDLTERIDLGSSFDLGMSVEVAEHLPKNSADTFIDNLCIHSKIILFSAAIPGQGGVEHINEQLPEYWIQKFADRGYQCHDIIRGYFWEDSDVECWYKQNMFLFVDGTINLHGTKILNYNETIPLYNIVHPQLLKLKGMDLDAKNKRLINREYLRKHCKWLYNILSI